MPSPNPVEEQKKAMVDKEHQTAAALGKLQITGNMVLADVLNNADLVLIVQWFEVNG